jgi:hypothetical protein
MINERRRETIIWKSGRDDTHPLLNLNSHAPDERESKRPVTRRDRRWRQKYPDDEEITKKRNRSVGLGGGLGADFSFFLPLTC